MIQHDPYTHDLPLDKEEINKIFAAYDFRDAIGNPLTLCIDFMVLVNAYAHSNPDGICNADRNRGRIFKLERKDGPPYPYIMVKPPDK